MAWLACVSSVQSITEFYNAIENSTDMDAIAMHPRVQLDLATISFTKTATEVSELRAQERDRMARAITRLLPPGQALQPTLTASEFFQHAKEAVASMCLPGVPHALEVSEGTMVRSA